MQLVHPDIPIMAGVTIGKAVPVQRDLGFVKIAHLAVAQLNEGTAVAELKTPSR